MKPKAGAHITPIIQVPYFVDEKDMAPLGSQMLNDWHNVTQLISGRGILYIKHLVPSVMLSVCVTRNSDEKAAS